jgi:hypothetical protein
MVVTDKQKNSCMNTYNPPLIKDAQMR